MRRRHSVRLLGLALVALLTLGGVVLGQGTRITFIAQPWGAPDQALLADFTSRTGIAVEIISLPSDQLYSRVQIASVANQAPADVVYLSEEAPSFIVTPGFVRPLNDLVERDGAAINVDEIQRRDFWTIDGNMYGLTAYVQLVMLDYNAARLAQAGLSPPTTWDAFFNAAVALKQQGLDQYPIAFGAIDWSWFLMALSMGDPLFDADLNPTFNAPDSQGRRAMRLLERMFDEGLITPDVITGTTPHSIFWGGIGTLHQAWQGSLSPGNNPNISQQAPNVRQLLMPEEHWTWALDAAIGISQFSQNVDAAWEFIKFYLSPENQIAIFNGVGLIPSRLSAQDTINAQGRNQDFEVQVEQAEYVRPLPRQVTWWGQWTTEVVAQIRTMAAGQTSADAVIDTIAAQWLDLKSEFE
ncbi:MAG: extracellular solute-binding protein [Deinococcus sp.]|nr:extracellular solute-binding protein [Deinococcus sp.]